MRSFAVSRFPWPGALGILLATAGLPDVASGAERERAPLEYEQWEQPLSEYFRKNPVLMETKGSGWKPYNRQKWFIEQRMENGELPAADARWQAWSERKNRASQLGRSTVTWFNIGPENLAGRMLQIAFDPVTPSTVYGGSAGGGLWKSTNSGDTWVPLTDELPSLAIGGVAVSPNDPNVVVIATGEGTWNIDRIGGVGILRSTDAGSTWQTTSLSYATSSGHGFHFLKANPITGTMMAGGTDGLYRSTDDGATWFQESSNDTWFDCQWKPGDANRLYLVRGSCNCNASGIKISTDDGQTWTGGVGAETGYAVGKSKLAVTAADPSRVYALFSDTNGNLLGFWRTTDDGATWTETATSPNIPGGQGWYNLSLTADPNDANRVIAGGVSLFRSNNGGLSFSTIGGSSVHVDHHCAEYEPGSDSNVWVGSDGGFWRSTNDGGSWTDRNKGLITYQFYDICVNKHPTSAYFVMGGTQDNGTDRYDGTSTDWGHGLGGDGMVCGISESGGKFVHAEIQFGVHYKNTNYGVGGWTSINAGITGNGRWVTPFAMNPFRGRHMYTETSDGIFKTNDSGTTWTNVSPHRAVWIDWSRHDSTTVWTVQNTASYTTDDGATWTNASSYGFSTGTATKIHTDPAHPAGAFVTFSGYTASAKIAHTTDWGATWSNVTGDLPPQPVNTMVVDPDSPNDWYIGTDTGVWKSQNGGTNWLPLGDASFPNTVVDDLEISHPHRKLVAGTHGRGAWELDIPLATDVTLPSIAAGAEGLMLDRPWPNPSRDQVTLRFAARSEGPVSLSIYDVAGRRVSEVADLSAGDGIIRTATWYPDRRGNGVYFAVLRSGAERVTRKLVVAR